MFPFSEKIQKDGKLQIHFDGWGSNYDYVIEPTSTNIHPVGWMDANKHAHKNLTQELQRPNSKFRPSILLLLIVIERQKWR